MTMQEERSRPGAPPRAAGQNVPANDLGDDACLDVLDRAVAGEPGIIAANLDPKREIVSLSYHPELLQEPQVAAIAQNVAAGIHQRLETCNLLLGKRGGRSCEACARVLEDRLQEVPGVRSAHASYLGGVLSVTYDQALLNDATVAERVRELRVPIVRPAIETYDETAQAPSEKLPWFGRARMWLTADRLEAIFTAITFVAMISALVLGKMHAPALITDGLYAIAYVAGGSFGLKAGLEALAQRTVDIDMLMVLAALGAAVVGAPFEGALLLFLFSLSNVLQAFAMDRTRNAIKALMKLRPATATVRRGDVILTLPIEKIELGDRMLLKPGERVGLDGVVAVGESAVDQSFITGESIPVNKIVGDTVYGGSINKNGSLELTVTRLAKDSTLARLIKMVEEAHSEKAQTQRFIDNFEQRYAFGVIVATFLAIVIPIFILSEPFDGAFYRAMTIMVAASPCALVISTPASILSAIGNGARRGVLFKGGVHLEQAATIKVVAFDKTGTLTEGRPQVTDVVIMHAEGARWHPQEGDLLALAAAVQSKSEHALAKATLEAARERDLQVSEAFAFQATTGKGVRGTVDGRSIHIGNLRYFEEFNVTNLQETEEKVVALQTKGKTCVAVGEMEQEGERVTILGLVAFADVLRPNVASVVQAIKAAGVEHVVMLSGDNKHVAEGIARQAGLDGFYAELLPEDKVSVLREIAHKYGPVAMVGDGVNDAPALATATLGIAMGAAGTDVALETADVVLMGDDLSNIPYLIKLSRHTRQTLVVNLVFAMGMIAIMILGIFAVHLPLPLAVVGHEGGTVLVSLNGLRLLAYKPLG